MSNWILVLLAASGMVWMKQCSFTLGQTQCTSWKGGGKGTTAKGGAKGFRRSDNFAFVGFGVRGVNDARGWTEVSRWDGWLRSRVKFYHHHVVEDSFLKK
jgi:hypothetical protein